jgi:predicted nucleotide-binding protein
MFELGMAAALGKRVVLIKNHKHSVPTDLAGFEYVSYRSAYELKDRLTKVLPEAEDAKG